MSVLQFDARPTCRCRCQLPSSVSTVDFRSHNCFSLFDPQRARFNCQLLVTPNRILQKAYRFEYSPLADSKYPLLLVLRVGSWISQPTNMALHLGARRIKSLAGQSALGFFVANHMFILVSCGFVHSFGFLCVGGGSHPHQQRGKHIIVASISLQSQPFRYTRILICIRTITQPTSTERLAWHLPAGTQLRRACRGQQRRSPGKPCCANTRFETVSFQLPES